MRATVLLLTMSVAAAAQTSSLYVYFAPGAVTSSGEAASTLHVGAGMDAVIAKGIGANLDFGLVGPREEMWANRVYMFSPGATYHFRRGKEMRIDPFLAGGYTLMFRGADSYIYHANAAYFGGGATFWPSQRVGLRLEFRDHVNWDYMPVHFWGFRLGVAFR